MVDHVARPAMCLNKTRSRRILPRPAEEVSEATPEAEEESAEEEAEEEAPHCPRLRVVLARRLG